MLSLILRALWIPLRDIVDVIKIFWPFFLICILAVGGFFFIAERFVELQVSLITRDISPEDLTEYSSYLAGIMLLGLYLGLLLLDGIVKWHRKLVLDEPARMISLFPKYRTWSYLGYTTLLFLFIIVIAAGASAVYEAFLDTIIKSARAGIDLTSTDGMQIFQSKIFYMSLFGMMILIIVILLLMSLFFKGFVLRLPKVAVEEKGFKLDKNKAKAAVRGPGWPTALFLIMLLPYIPLMIFMFVLLSTELVPVNQFITNEHLQNPWGIAYEVASSVVSIYGPIAFATLLSLFYRERVRTA